MNDAPPEVADPLTDSAIPTDALSEAARQRLLSIGANRSFSRAGTALFFIHYEAEPESLQKCVRFDSICVMVGHSSALSPLRLLGCARESGGRIGEWLLKPIGTHGFLNVRTYVHHNGEPGIYFLAEWLSNALAVRLGPWTFGLPYRYGHLQLRAFE